MVLFKFCSEIQMLAVLSLLSPVKYLLRDGTPTAPLFVAWCGYMRGGVWKE